MCTTVLTSHVVGRFHTDPADATSREKNTQTMYHLNRSTEMLLMHEALARARMREAVHPELKQSRHARRPARQVAAAAARMRELF